MVLGTIVGLVGQAASADSIQTLLRGCGVPADAEPSSIETPPCCLGGAGLSSDPANRGRLLVARHGDHLCAVVGSIFVGNRCLVAPDGTWDVATVAQLPQSVELQEELTGSFSLAVCHQGTGSLWLMRDPGGSEPLYYATSPTAIRFASRAVALTRLAEVSGDFDAQTFAEVCLDLPIRCGATHFREVRAVPRASVVLWRDGAASVRRYWSLSASRRVCGEKAECELRRTFSAAVGRAVSGSRRPAVTLSGGIDSSSIFCAAHQQRGQSVLAISLRFPGDRDATESEYQKDVLRGTGCVSRIASFEPTQAFIQDPLATDHPSALLMAGVLGTCFSIAEREGADRVLVGSHGDVVGGGVQVAPTEMAMRGMWGELLGDVWARTRGRRLHGLRLLVSHGLLGTSQRYRRWSMRRQGRARSRWALLQTMSPEIRREFCLEDRWRESAEAYVSPSEHRLAYLDGFLDGQARGETEVLWALSRQSGIESCQPFLDGELLRVSATLELRQCQGDGRARLAFKRAMEGLVPRSVLERRTKANLLRPHQRCWKLICDTALSRGAFRPILELLEIGSLASIGDWPGSDELRALLACCGLWQQAVQEPRGILW